MNRPLQLGTFVKTASPHVIEVLGTTRLDFVCIDAEHAPLDRAMLDLMVLAARATHLQAFIRIPEIRPAMDLEQWCAEEESGLKLNLHPRASQSINTLPLPVERVRLLIGPEGGLSADEIAMTARYQFTDILL